MQHRSPAAVFILSLVTFGIYAIYWEVKTKGELVRQALRFLLRGCLSYP